MGASWLQDIEVYIDNVETTEKPSWKEWQNCLPARDSFASVQSLDRSTELISIRSKGNYKY